MKIGIVCYPSLGGSGVVATELGHALAARGHEVHFITYEMPFRLQLGNGNLHFHQVDVYSYDLFTYPDYALPLAVKMAEVASEYDLDILHVHYAIPHATSAFLAKQILGKSRPAVITTLHGTDITLVGRDPAYFQIVKFSIEQSDGVTAVSQNLAAQTRCFFDINKEIEVIYNFFVPKKEWVGTKPLHQTMAPKGEKILLHASNFRSVKRVEDVLHVFKRVREQIPAKLFLAGAGAGIEEIRTKVIEYQLDSDVTFIGKKREVDRYIASADVFLLPSSQESFGLVALEAMSYGVPVVASHVGGLPEVIAHGKTGFLAPVGDVDAMTRHTLELLTNPALYQEMSQAGIKSACERFCTSYIIPQYEEYYKKILSQSMR